MSMFSSPERSARVDDTTAEIHPHHQPAATTDLPNRPGWKFCLFTDVQPPIVTAANPNGQMRARAEVDPQVVSDAVALDSMHDSGAKGLVVSRVVIDRLFAEAEAAQANIVSPNPNPGV